MTLQEILNGVEVTASSAAMDLVVGELRYDSRAVKPGDIFVAIRGFETDGHKYIGKAMELGAAAVVCEDIPLHGEPYVQVVSSRRALAQMAANYFGHPAKEMTMVGITGTNGKTTSSRRSSRLSLSRAKVILPTVRGLTSFPA